MLILQALGKIWANVADYIATFIKASFDALFLGMLEQARFLKFYLIQLPICAAILWLLFVFSNQANLPAAATPCYPASPSIIGLLVLAEVAALLLFGLAYAEAAALLHWGPVRVEAELAKKYPRVGAGDRRSNLARLIYLPMLAWFPVALAIAVTVSSSRLVDVAEACFAAGRVQPWYAWVSAIAPGLLAGFATVVTINWVVYRWRWSLLIGAIITGSFAGYVVVYLVVGPADIVGLVHAMRQLPVAWERIGRLLGLTVPLPL